MSDVNDASSKPSSRPKPSLRELAERAKQAEMTRRAAEPSLAAVTATVPPPSVPEETPPPVAGTQPPPAAPAPVKSRFGLAVGLGVAVIGIAAASVLVIRGRHPKTS